MSYKKLEQLFTKNESVLIQHSPSVGKSEILRNSEQQTQQVHSDNLNTPLPIDEVKIVFDSATQNKMGVWLKEGHLYADEGTTDLNLQQKFY
ncbi:MAG: hypothetical protein Q8M03_13015 [Legionella sp.]|nr:hypothetical protein [Legionella sp.]